MKYLLAPSVLLGDEYPISLQSLQIISVLLPESFRGGCSFGAAIKAVSPENDLNTVNTIPSNIALLIHSKMMHQLLYSHH